MYYKKQVTVDYLSNDLIKGNIIKTVSIWVHRSGYDRGYFSFGFYYFRKKQ
jgi:hypothetical protein